MVLKYKGYNVIYDIEKLEEDWWLINKSVKVLFKEDDTMDVEYNEEDLTEKEVNNLINNFLETVIDSYKDKNNVL